MNGSKNTIKRVFLLLGAGIMILLLNVAFLFIRDSVYNKIVSADRDTALAVTTNQYAAPPEAVTYVSVETTAAPETQPAVPPTDPSPNGLPHTLEIEMINGNLTLETGLFFNVRYDPSVILMENTGEVLSIRNAKSSPTVSERMRMNVTVTVPEGYSFDNVNMSMGAGKLTVMGLRTKDLRLEMGAGNATLIRLIVSGSAEIQNGAGAFAVRNGTINNLTLHCGAGSTYVKAALTGENRITASIGAVELALDGPENDYTVSFNVNFSVCYFNDVRRYNSDSFGSGPNRVDITGGVGVMRIRTG